MCSVIIIPYCHMLYVFILHSKIMASYYIVLVACVMLHRKVTGHMMLVLDQWMAHYNTIGVHLVTVGVVAIVCVIVYTIMTTMIFSVSVIDKVPYTCITRH